MAGASGIGLAGARFGVEEGLTNRTEDLVLPNNGEWKVFTYYYIKNKSIPDTQNPFAGLLQFERDKVGVERYAKKHETPVKFVKYIKDSKGWLFNGSGSYMVKDTGGQA